MRGMPPLSRRALLVGLAVTATGRRAHAQPKVFLDYDQDALDRAYDQRAWAPNMDAVLKRYVVNSDGVRARLGAPKTVAYGASAIETRSEEHTSELQSRPHLVCRLLPE